MKIIDFLTFLARYSKEESRLKLDAKLNEISLDSSKVKL